MKGILHYKNWHLRQACCDSRLSVKHCLTHHPELTHRQKYLTLTGLWADWGTCVLIWRLALELTSHGVLSVYRCGPMKHNPPIDPRVGGGKEHFPKSNRIRHH